MQTARVAIVGAGAVGLACALQLRRAGVPDVVVLDRHPAPGQGSTGRANGGFRAQFAAPINIAFSQYTIAELERLDAATEGTVGLRQVGYLFMVGSEAGERALRTSFELQRSLGVPVEWLTPDQVLELAPYIRREGLRAGTFCQSDGILDPSGVVLAMSREARRLGVRLLLDSEVVSIEGRGSLMRLGSAGGPLEAEVVVDAAGSEAATVGAMVGLELPIEPYRRNLACTQPLASPPGEIPMCVDLDTGVLVRREGAGFLLAYSDPGDRPTDRTEFDPAFLEALATRIGHRFPFLESVGIDQRKCWAGLYPETPDHHAIIDRAPDLPGFVVCAGFGGHGIMHSLAAGQAVAELVVAGRCSSFDLDPFRLARFGAGELVMESIVL